MEKKWMTVKDVADYLQISEESIYKLAQRRQLPGAKIVSQWRFKRSDIDMWVEEKKVGRRGSLV